MLHSAPFLSAPRRPSPSAGQIPLEGESWRMRRYELMLVLRPDVADDRAQAVIDRTTRQIVAGGGQIVKVAPWGRRRLAYQIDRYREGSYHIVLFEAPARGDRSSWSAASRSPRRSSATSSPASSGRSRRLAAPAPRARTPRTTTRPPVRRGRRGRVRRPRADRRIRERSGSGRHRLREPTMALCKAMIIGNLGRGSRDALHAQRPARDAVQRRGQPEHEEPADRRVGRGDRLVPGQRLGRPRRAGRGEPAQGQPRVRRGPLPDPRVRGPRRPEADLARDHRRQRREPREARPRRGRVDSAASPAGARWRAGGGGPPAVPAGGGGGRRRRRPTSTTPTSTTSRF